MILNNTFVTEVSLLSGAILSALSTLVYVLPVAGLCGQMFLFCGIKAAKRLHEMKSFNTLCKVSHDPS